MLPSSIRGKRCNACPISFLSVSRRDALCASLPGRIMKTPTKPFALCIDNTDYRASLIPGKVYRILPDPVAAKDDLVRIVDESGEDYLYHKDHFLMVDFPPQCDEKDSRLAVHRVNRSKRSADLF